MRRHAIGIFAVLLLSAAVGLWIWPLGEGGMPGIEAAFWRVGSVMAVLWLAYPDLRRLPAWLLFFGPLVLVLVAFRPRLFVLLIPVIVVIAVLRWLKRPIG